MRGSHIVCAGACDNMWQLVYLSLKLTTHYVLGSQLAFRWTLAAGMFQHARAHVT